MTQQPGEQGNQDPWVSPGHQDQGGQPPYGQPGYPPPSYGQPGQPGQPGHPPPGYGPPAQPYPVAAPTNTMAILALIFAFVFSPLGIVFGIIGKNQIKQTGEQGDGLATAGIVIGAVFTALVVIAIVFFIIAAVTIVNTVPTFPPPPR